MKGKYIIASVLGLFCAGAGIINAVGASAAASKGDFLSRFRKDMASLVTMDDKVAPISKPPLATFPEKFVTLKPEVTGKDGVLIFSDSPEYVGNQSGILYEDRFKGAGRIYFYHVNHSEADRKMAIVLKNKSNQENIITVNRELVSWPSPDYFAVGRRLSRLEAENKLGIPKVYKLKADEKILLFPRLEKIAVKPNRLISGIVDFSSTDLVQVSTLMVPINDDAVAHYEEYAMLPNDSHRLRGTFIGAHRHIDVFPAYNPSVGAAQLTINSSDGAYYVKGKDMTMGFLRPESRIKDIEAMARFIPDASANFNDNSNRGNYGIDDTIQIATMGKGKYSLYFNTLGGPFAGTIRISYKGKDTLWDLPDASYPFMGKGTIYDTRYIGTYEGGYPLEIHFMSPGASNLPVRFMFIPEV